MNWSLYRMKYPALDWAVLLAKALLVAFVAVKLLGGCGDAFGVAGSDGGGGAVEGGGAADAARDAQGSPLDAGHDAGGPDAAAAEAGGDSSPPDSSPLDVGAPDAPPAETAPTCTPISPQNADTCGQSGNWPEQYVVWIDSSCAGSGDVWYTTPSSCLCLETYDCACVLAADPHFGMENCYCSQPSGSGTLVEVTCPML